MTTAIRVMAACDPLSMSSVGWGGEGGGFGGYTASRARDPTPLGGGVLSGDRVRAGGVPAEARADYRGRGPRGYRRSDARIYEEVNERLTADPQLDAGDIMVEVNDGLVILRGTVEQRWMKHRAEDLAESCRHVRDIENHLRIARRDAVPQRAADNAPSPLDIDESTGGSAMASARSAARKGESTH